MMEINLRSLPAGQKHAERAMGAGFVHPKWLIAWQLLFEAVIQG